MYNRCVRNSLRLAELLASLSLAIDLGTGQPMEWVMRCCLMGVRFAELLGLTDHDIRAVYNLSLLRHVGCTSTATLEADLFSNELELGEGLLVDSKHIPQAFRFLIRNAGKGYAFPERARFIGKALMAGPASKDLIDRTQCEVAVGLAGALNISPEIQSMLNQVYERWDGRGTPNQLKAEAIALPVRVIQVSQDAVTFQMLAGIESAINGVRLHAGRILDPLLVDSFCKSSHDLFVHLNPRSLWDAVIAAEPGEPKFLAGEHLDNAMRAVADFTDLKSPYFTGHSRAVGDLVARAAKTMSLSETDMQMLRHAGMIHDIGCVGVSATLWNKAETLTESEWERVRLHVNFTERIFARSNAFSPVGDLAALHHERLDGSGYHRRLPAMLLPLPARLLAVADVYCAMTEPRPHRPALLPEQAADELRREVKTGRLDAASTSAVLDAAGYKVEQPSLKTFPTLTPRELEVIRLMARGYTTKAIAYHLSIASKTADHHIQNIYGKIGVSTRAGATLYAMQNNLL